MESMLLLAVTPINHKTPLAPLLEASYPHSMPRDNKWITFTSIVCQSQWVRKRGKKVFLNSSFAKRLHVAHVFNHGWRQLAVGGW